MQKNRQLIEEVIQGRKMKNDPAKEIAIRNKASPLNIWSKFKPFTEARFNSIFKLNIDGVKLRFKNLTFIINGRHKNN